MSLATLFLFFAGAMAWLGLVIYSIFRRNQNFSFNKIYPYYFFR